MIVTMRSIVFCGDVTVSVPDKEKDGKPLTIGDAIEEATNRICNIKPEEVSCVQVENITNVLQPRRK